MNCPECGMKSGHKMDCATGRYPAGRRMYDQALARHAWGKIAHYLNMLEVRGLTECSGYKIVHNGNKWVVREEGD